LAAAAAALVLVVVVRVIGRRTRLRSLCCGQLSLCRRLFTVAAAVAAGKIRLLLCRRGNNSASSASLAAFAGPRAPREDGGLPPSAAACRARRATGTSWGAPERCACVRACEWRWVEWFSGLPGSCARSARDFFFPHFKSVFACCGFHVFLDRSLASLRSRQLPALLSCSSRLCG